MLKNPRAKKEGENRIRQKRKSLKKQGGRARNQYLDWHSPLLAFPHCNQRDSAFMIWPTGVGVEAFV